MTSTAENSSGTLKYLMVRYTIDQIPHKTAARRRTYILEMRHSMFPTDKCGVSELHHSIRNMRCLNKRVNITQNENRCFSSPALRPARQVNS